MKASLLLCVALFVALPAFGQSARQLTRRIAPQLPPPPPPARPGSPGQPAAAAPAVDQAKVAAQKEKTDSNLIKYYKQRAEAGSDNAQYELGVRYLDGNGVAKDAKLGREWIAKAAKAGNPKAVKKLEELGPEPEPVKAKDAKPAPAAK